MSCNDSKSGRLMGCNILVVLLEVGDTIEQCDDGMMMLMMMMGGVGG